MTFLSGIFPVLTPQPSEVKQLKVEVFTQDETNVGCFGIDFFTLSLSEDALLFKRWPADIELRYSLLPSSHIREIISVMYYSAKRAQI